MKRRHGFVANSSSSCFLIRISDLSPEQVKMFQSNEGLDQAIRAWLDAGNQSRHPNLTFPLFGEDSELEMSYNTLNEESDYIECGGDSDSVYFVRDLFCEMGIPKKAIEFQWKGWR
jgi:hypothetical protein